MNCDTAAFIFSAFNNQFSQLTMLNKAKENRRCTDQTKYWWEIIPAPATPGTDNKSQHTRDVVIKTFSTCRELSSNKGMWKSSKYKGKEVDF